MHTQIDWPNDDDVVCWMSAICICYRFSITVFCLSQGDFLSLTRLMRRSSIILILWVTMLLNSERLLWNELQNKTTKTNKNDVERRQTLGHLRSINPNIITLHQKSHFLFLSCMLSVHGAIQILYPCHLQCQQLGERSNSGSTSRGTVKFRCQPACWLFVDICRYWFSCFSNFANRYRKSISIIKTHSIDNFDFLAH